MYQYSNRLRTPSVNQEEGDQIRAIFTKDSAPLAAGHQSPLRHIGDSMRLTHQEISIASKLGVIREEVQLTNDIASGARNTSGRSRPANTTTLSPLRLWRSGTSSCSSGCPWSGGRSGGGSGSGSLDPGGGSGGSRP